MLCFISLLGNLSQYLDAEKQDVVNQSWFDGTWLNHITYDDATIQLYFLNIYDDVIIYTKDKGEVNWSNPRCSDFAVFYSSEVYGDYQNYVIYSELPLNSNVYLCSLWSSGDVFEIYYGENEHMRFYKVD